MTHEAPILVPIDSSAISSSDSYNLGTNLERLRTSSPVCTLIIYPLLGSRHLGCMFCLHYHHPRWSFTPSQSCQTDWQKKLRVVLSTNPTSPHTNYAFLLSCHYCCFDSIYVCQCML
ncbi:hypothetical protein K503DRAFT_569252 [Rhizopogon vinicolor AM-OR11-026]|uniref:Uncharacterized protein n=1 Tax=Rhizopogon vinicolor AM-OR11-026 TaxID=1314800 RepID=A0A1B7MJZ1_9AGAM|nr:hypothetical protein K503DRAFT_569252 [Rhizopogon vinicolor AM-OR11-026]